jgi:drug/metabolite transporter (DMT)-like permease
MSPAHLRRQALQMLLLCTSFWALSFPLMKTLGLTQQQILPGAGSWFLSSLCVLLRFLSAGLLLLLFSPAQIRTASRREIEQGIWLAFFASAGICLQMDGLAYVSASTSAFLTQLYCVLIPLWVAVSRLRFPTMKILICSGLVLSGMAILVKLNLFALRLGRGELETLASSVMFTAQILWLEHPRYAANRPQCFTTIMLLAMGLFAVPVVVVTAPGVAECFQVYQSLPACGLVAGLVLVCSLCPFLLMNRWQREVTATEAGLVYCAEPVLVSLVALFLPGWLSHWTGVGYANEQVTARLLFGGGLITAANVLLQSRWLEAKPDGLR